MGLPLYNLHVVAQKRVLSQMKNLPSAIKQKFYSAFEEVITLAEFEQWVYKSDELAQAVSENDYLELISLGYKRSGAKHELRKILARYIDFAEFELTRMLLLLEEARLKTERLPFILIEFYALYCKGYSFLQELGISYGLAVDCPRVENTAADTWEELSQQQQQKLIYSFSPGLEKEIERVIGWLDKGQIVLTGQRDANNYYEYVDFRSKSDLNE